MKTIKAFFLRLNLIDGGIVFRTRVEDGVGVFIEPAPRPNHMQATVRELTADEMELVRGGHRVSDFWKAKPVHYVW